MAALGNRRERNDRRTVGIGPAVHQDDGLERGSWCRTSWIFWSCSLVETNAAFTPASCRMWACAGGERGIDRHRSRRSGDDREIGHQPLGPTLGDDSDAIPRPNPERAQPERQVADALEELLARQRLDPVRAAATDQFWILKPARDVKRQVGDRLEVDLGAASSRTAAAVVLTSGLYAG
jgi:hypothetical protein